MSHVDIAERRDALFVDLQRRIEQMPGVESATLSVVVPLAFTGREEFPVVLEDAAPSGRRPWVMATGAFGRRRGKRAACPQSRTP